MEEKNETNKGKVFINVIIILLMLILGLYLYSRYIETSKLVVKEYKISSENLPISFSGIKIIHISDVYFGNTTHIENINKLVEKVNFLEPDLILFTGDLFGDVIKNKDELIESLSKLESTVGKYAVKGDNDYIEDYETLMNDIGFQVLNNEFTLIYNKSLIPIYLCGLGSLTKEDASIETCEEYFNNLGEDLYAPTYKIIMVHEGDTVNKLLKSSIKPDLILSGNSLNGTIKLPYYGQIFIPVGSKEYFGEYYNRNGIDIYISSGIGTDKYPYRLFNPPSFNFYRLKSLQ